MKELNKKEEQIKDILGGLEIDIDTNDIWANIESELPQPKKKRRFVIFLLFGIFSLGLVGLGWTMGKFATTDIDAQNINISSTSSVENIVVIAEKITAESNTTTKINQQTKIKIQDEKSNSYKITNEVISTDPIQLNSTASNVTKKEKINAFLHTKIEKESNPIFTSNAVESDKTFIETKLNIDTKTTEANELELQEERNTIPGLGLTPTLSSQLFEIAQRQRIESSPSSISPLHNNGRQLILQFKLGANQNRTSISNINSTGEFDGSEFDFERDRLGLSGTFNIGVENNGWRFLAGASYHHHVSSYERNDVLIVKDPVTGIESYKISTDGITTAQNGTITVTSARDNKISYHRQHRAIDFHATIGKRLWSYKGLVLIADAGFGVNTLTNSSGYYISDKAFGFTKFSDDNHPYKINTHWNAIASMEIGYNFGKTRIGLSPFIRYNPNSITSQTHLYTLKNSQVGMQLSLTYTPTRE